MRRAMLFLSAVLLLSSGCKQYVTLFPLANPNQPVYDDQLLGRWYGAQENEDPLTGEKVLVADTSNHFTFTKYGITGYKLSAENTKKETSIEFETRPFQVGDQKFLQLQRTKSSVSEQNVGILRVYYFMPYRIENDRLFVKFTPTDRLQALAKDAGIPMVEAEGTLLLTGNRQQMLDFLEKHMDELFPQDRETKPLYRDKILNLDVADQS
ncbi:hypothetical protein C5Y96_06400 [Blastopirellula marina]|uniref:Lipocalin-like domain-containing protein n=1 Tax=Blastopirellula marina TaxID=124 RepID=A0A2S8FY75_9BACT|nr:MULTISPECIES: hypothetical protein [Pirellulaceae]PQO36794.1 hypothetical protein C5Y96_06400 [Blastopirellula marina]RCS53509.1 hypothetical protein DTL36_06410 [Bremerella cremea]